MRLQNRQQISHDRKSSLSAHFGEKITSIFYILFQVQLAISTEFERFSSFQKQFKLKKQMESESVIAIDSKISIFGKTSISFNAAIKTTFQTKIHFYYSFLFEMSFTLKSRDYFAFIHLCSDKNVV